MVEGKEVENQSMTVVVLIYECYNNKEEDCIYESVEEFYSVDAGSSIANNKQHVFLC